MTRRWDWTREQISPSLFNLCFTFFFLIRSLGFISSLLISSRDVLAGLSGWGALLIPRDPIGQTVKPQAGRRSPCPRRCPVTAALPRVSQEPSAPALGRGSVMPAEDTRAGNLHGAFLFYPSYLKVQRFWPLFSFCTTPASRSLGVQVPGQAGAGRRPLDDPGDCAAKATLSGGIGVASSCRTCLGGVGSVCWFTEEGLGALP